MAETPKQGGAQEGQAVDFEALRKRALARAKRKFVEEQWKGIAARDNVANIRSKTGAAIVLAGAMVLGITGAAGVHQVVKFGEGLFSSKDGSRPAAEAPLAPQLQGQPSASPATKSSPSKPQAGQIRLHEAQRAIETAMGNQVLPPAPPSAGKLRPAGKDDLKEISDKYRHAYSVTFIVTPAEAAGYTDCSLLVHQNRGNEKVNNANVQQAVASLAAGNMVAAGQACNAVLVDGHYQGASYTPLKEL